MTNESHLYPGFRYAGALPSIKIQRLIQGRLIEKLPLKRILVVGSGYGEELETFLGCYASTSDWPDVAVIDLANVVTHLKAQPRISCLGRKLAFQQLDLMEAYMLGGFGRFDSVQCSFVLHDIRPALKQHALSILTDAVRPGGYVLISDIFVQAAQNQAEVANIYDTFIQEADRALQGGQLTRDEFDALVGDGDRIGLIHTRREAVRSQRDFFEPLDMLVACADQVGLRIVNIISNPKNAHLLVLLFRREYRSKAHLKWAIKDTHVL